MRTLLVPRFSYLGLHGAVMRLVKRCDSVTMRDHQSPLSVLATGELLRALRKGQTSEKNSRLTGDDRYLVVRER